MREEGKIRSVFLRYWPTLLAAIMILGLAVMVDASSRWAQFQRERDRVAFELGTIRSNLGRIMIGTYSSAWRMATRLERLDEVTVPRFQDLAEQGFPDRRLLSCLSWSEGYQVVFVHVDDGCLAPPGADLRDQSLFGEHLENMLGLSALVAEGPLRIDLDKAIHVMRFAVEEGAAPVSQGVRGVLSVGISLKAALAAAGADGANTQIMLAVTTEGSSGGLENVVLGPREVLAAGSISEQVVLPGGSFTLHAVPREGWLAGRDRITGERMALALIALAMVGMAFLANSASLKRQQAASEREIARDQLWGILKNMPGAAYTFTAMPGTDPASHDGRLTFFNRGACYRIWGVPATVVEAEPGKLWELIDDPELREELHRKALESERRMAAWQHVWPILTPSGHRKWLDGRGHPVRLEDGAIRWYSLVVDATDRVAAAHELQLQRDLAHKAQKTESIGQLTGGVAHDFNNLLAVIMGNLELLRDDHEDPSQIALIDSGIAAAHRGADLTRSMLAFARKARLEPRQVDLNALVTETRNWAGRTLPANIEIQVSLAEGLWPIVADPASTESALLNLIVNARDAMPDGGRLSISTANLVIAEDASPAELIPEEDAAEGGLAPGRYVALSVADTGEGISPELFARIFEPFYSTKGPGAGTGLGLSMVQGFMKQSGGSVEVISAPGQGARFLLYFRALEQPGEDRPVRGNQGRGPGLPGRRILVAEDEPDLRAMLEQILSKAGYDVTSAPSGDAALCALPGGSGLRSAAERYRHARSHPGARSLPQAAQGTAGPAGGLPVGLFEGIQRDREGPLRRHPAPDETGRPRNPAGRSCKCAWRRRRAAAGAGEGRARGRGRLARPSARGSPRISCSRQARAQAFRFPPPLRRFLARPRRGDPGAGPGRGQCQPGRTRARDRPGDALPPHETSRYRSKLSAPVSALRQVQLQHRPPRADRGGCDRAGLLQPGSRNPGFPWRTPDERDEPAEGDQAGRSAADGDHDRRPGEPGAAGQDHVLFHHRPRRRGRGAGGRRCRASGRRTGEGVLYPADDPAWQQFHARLPGGDLRPCGLGHHVQR